MEFGVGEEQTSILRIAGPFERGLEVLVMRNHLLRVDGDDNALASEAHGGGLDELRVVDSRGVDRNLVASGEQEVADIVKDLDASTHGERHEDLLRRAAHDIEDDAALLMRGRDVEERELVRALLVVDLRYLDGVACIAQVHEAYAFYYPPCFHVKAGYDAFG